MTREQDRRSKDIEVTDPSGPTYRICTRRRGEPMRAWEGAETGFGTLDLLVFAGSLSQRLITAARVRSRHGWTVGVLQEVDLRWRVVHREHVEDEAWAIRRAQELSRAITVERSRADHESRCGHARTCVTGGARPVLAGGWQSTRREQAGRPCR
jgi:hypothetical protein